MDMTRWAAARTKQPQRRFPWRGRPHPSVCPDCGRTRHWYVGKRWVCTHCADADPIPDALDTLAIVADWARNNPSIDAEQAADCIDSFARVADALANPPRRVQTPYGDVDERDTERLRLRNWRQHADRAQTNPFKRGGLRGNPPAISDDCPCGCGPPIADARTQRVVRKQLVTTLLGTDRPGQIVMLEPGEVVLSRAREELIRKYAKPEQPCDECETVVTDCGTRQERICTGRCVTDVTVNRPQPDTLTSIKS